MVSRVSPAQRSLPQLAQLPRCSWLSSRSSWVQKRALIPSRLALSGQRAAQALGRSQGTLRGCFTPYLSWPRAPSSLSIVATGPHELRQALPGLRSVPHILTEAGAVGFALLLPAPRGAGEELQDGPSRAGGTSAYPADSRLWCQEASPGFSPRAVSRRRNCQCSASLPALPLLIAGRFLLHGERSRA